MSEFRKPPHWLHIGPLHLGVANHRHWPVFHSDRRNGPAFKRIHVGRFCFRLRIGKAKP